MAPTGEMKAKNENSMNEELTHTSKVIRPIDPALAGLTDEEVSSSTAAELPDTQEPEVEQKTAEEPAKEADKSAAETDVAVPAPTSVTSLGDTSSDDEETVSVEEVAEAEARAKREEELEALIASGKYILPVDALRRKRSRVATIYLCLLALVLAVALFDVVADVGIVKPPSSVPHTHFFSK